MGQLMNFIPEDDIELKAGKFFQCGIRDYNRCKVFRARTADRLDDDA